MGAMWLQTSIILETLSYGESWHVDGSEICSYIILLNTSRKDIVTPVSVRTSVPNTKCRVGVRDTL
jgi:hypothetical protein